MEITLDLIKELRNKTGAGIADCKKALVENDGDIQKAIEDLRKKGAATALKRADKATNEGAVKAKISDDRKFGAIIELTCETDFVSRGNDFQSLSDRVAEAAFNAKTNDVEKVLSSKTTNNLTVKEDIDSVVSSVAEKVELRRVATMECADGFICEYIHFGSKLGSLVAIKGKLTPESEALGKSIAMQVVAMSPMAIDRKGISDEIMAKEKEIYLEAAKNEGKKADIAERITSNKVEKFYQDNCLIEQESIKESGRSVQELMNDYKKKSGEALEVVDMIRFHIGG
ncbi:translation elongation factor Ts [soil metagenome]